MFPIGMITPMPFRTTQATTVLLLTAALLAPLACAPSSKSAKSTRGPARSQIPNPGPDAPGKPTAPISNTDPCAERLHALCGPLLFYYALHRRLPERLDELRALADPIDAPVEFTCPVSGLPYVYAPQGVRRPGGQPGVLVLYDAAPSHSGMRWAVAVDEPTRPGQPLVTKVVPEPEVVFHPPE